MSTAAVSAAARPDLSALSRQCGIPLHLYRRSHVERCLERALSRTGLHSVSQLTERVRRDASVRSALRRSVLVAVTEMFRDPPQFELLQHRVIPELVASGRRINVWSAGCSDGRELRSVAHLLEQAGVLWRCSLLGSDVLEEVLEMAERSRSELSPQARAAISFERRDLVLEAPPARTFDLILCRNMSIYLEPEAQRTLRWHLLGTLRPGGYLMLGGSETLVRPQDLGLERVSRHIFRRMVAA